MEPSPQASPQVAMVPKFEAKKRAAIAAQNVGVSADIHIPLIPKDATTVQLLGQSMFSPWWTLLAHA